MVAGRLAGPIRKFNLIHPEVLPVQQILFGIIQTKDSELEHHLHIKHFLFPGLLWQIHSSQQQPPPQHLSEEYPPTFFRLHPQLLLQLLQTESI